jgi:hypothetical protein
MVEQVQGRSWSPLMHRRLWIVPGLLTFFLPLLAFAFLKDVLWTLLPSEWFDTRALPLLHGKPDSFGVFARDIEGRMNFSILSVAIWVAGPVATVIAFQVIRRAFQLRDSLLIMSVAIAIGIGIGISDMFDDKLDCGPPSKPESTIHVEKRQGFRFVIMDYVMCAAEHDKPDKAHVLPRTRRMILLNTFIGFSGAAAVMAAFGAISVRRGGRSEIAQLRQRLSDFRTLSLVAGLLFVLNALVTKALMSWTQGLLDPEKTAGSFARLGNALLNYWAAESSTVLLVTVSCAALFIRADINRVAKRELSPENVKIADVSNIQQPAASARGGALTNETKWKEANGLTFETSTVLLATISTIPPFLASPAVDLVTKALH